MWFKIEPKEIKKDIRNRFSRFLVNLAKKIRPDSEEVKAYMAEIFIEHYLKGKPMKIIEPEDVDR